MIVFAIFNMFFEFERMFFEIKFTISNHKVKLNAKTIEVLKCCKSWNRAKMFIDVVVNVIMKHLKNAMTKNEKNEKDEKDEKDKKNEKWRSML